MIDKLQPPDSHYLEAAQGWLEFWGIPRKPTRSWRESLRVSAPILTCWKSGGKSTPKPRNGKLASILRRPSSNKRRNEHWAGFIARSPCTNWSGRKKHAIFCCRRSRNSRRNGLFGTTWPATHPNLGRCGRPGLRSKKPLSVGAARRSS